jgi:putative restriction endonuclease
MIYFHAIEDGIYVAGYPTFVVGEDPVRQFFQLQVEDAAAFTDLLEATRVAEDDAEPRRAYVTRSFKFRIHQEAFRERVLRAYRERCALCRLGHRVLLDAAHITGDADPEGEPLVSNGLALCKLHHVAFDQFFFAVRPDYRIEVRSSILAERDGPMLIVGLQEIHGQQIQLPAALRQRPDRDRLARRYAEFKQAS